MPRQKISIEGIVQGVGFRPFVYQAARACNLAGWVRNDSRGVTIEAEGTPRDLTRFVEILTQQPPPLATITQLSITDIAAGGGAGFVIHPSADEGAANAQIAPDSFVCSDCLRELFDPADRRFRYPFINCTNCGPRYSIILATPYDRPATTMGEFSMCPGCRSEYDNPLSRRFHAQPNACPECGPQLVLLDGAGHVEAREDAAISVCAERLRQGQIVAVKGLGGYHLVVDAACEHAVAELRRRKLREEKPFALMSANPDRVRGYACLGEVEQALLEGVERPIVLLRGRDDHQLAPSVAPGNRYFGVMLPSTPVQHLLLAEGFSALVMTSGNRSDEPIAYRDDEALGRLCDIADAFLVHNRRIHIRSDDSIARVLGGKALLLRRSRGFVPRSLPLFKETTPVLALGAELKNAVCLTRRDRGYLGEHIGDLKNLETFEALQGSVAHLQQLLDVTPEIVAHDLHPDYLSTRYAETVSASRRVAVQHHHAHLVACLAEHHEPGPALGVIFDGTGYGPDGTIWGGEFLCGDASGFTRLAHLAPVALPGGDLAVREPWRMAVSYLQHTFGSDFQLPSSLTGLISADELLVRQMIVRGINSPLTSSCGRLFDGVAALLGLRRKVSYEGQAALDLEMILDPDENGCYPFEYVQQVERLVIDPAPLIRALVADLALGLPPARLSARFHRSITAMVASVCDQLRRQTGLSQVVLSGGVFQNAFLAEAVVQRLRNDGFCVLTHALVPPNDGGIALGQAVIAGHSSV